MPPPAQSSPTSAAALTVTPPAVPALVTYRLTAPLPPKLRFRNGDVALEIVRDCASQDVPIWVLRARRIVYGYRTDLPLARSTAATSSSSSMPRITRPLPTVSPASMAVPVGASVVLASSLFGKRELQRVIRSEGFAVVAGSAAGRVMEALVRMQCATVITGNGVLNRH